MFRVAKMIVLIAVMYCGSFAQAQTSQISGKVSDTSGAVVAGSELILTNSETGIKRSASSNDSGVYLLPLLNPGTYDILVRKQGFRSISKAGIKLYVNDRTQIDFILEIGAVAETVTVSATVPLLETQSGTVRGVVDQQRIEDLPLNGRDIVQLVSIQAGIIPQGGDEKEGFSFSANGSRGNGIAYLLDGGYNTHTYRNASGLFPNPDAVQEFSIQRNNFSAEYGNATGAVVSVVTRSGTNQIHGSAFEFLRNAQLNARSFFAPRRDTLKRNQYGATIGGPVIRDKVFFFGSYQATKLRSDPGLVRQFLPTAAYRAGSFAAAPRSITDPLGRQPFPGNQIPRSRLNQVTLAFLPYLPDPGTATGERFTGARLNPDEPEYLGRLDASLGRHSLSGHVFIRRFKKPFGASLQDYASMYASDVADQVQDQDHHTVNHVFTVSPRLINSFMFSYRNRTTAQDWSQTRVPFTFADAGVKGIAVPDPPGVYIDVSGDFLARPGRHAALVHRDLHWTNTATFVKGRQEIKFGAEVIRSANEIRNTFTATGTFLFDGFATGLAAADFMLGEVRQFGQGGGEFKDVVGNRWGFFVQDNFRVHPTLMLNLGLRWDPTLPFRENFGRVQCFRPGAQSSRFPNSPRGYLHGGDPGCPEGGFDPYWRAISPRFGFAWSAASRLVVRGGVGFFWDPQFTSLYNPFDSAAPHSPQVQRLAVKFDDPYQGAENPFPAQFGPFHPTRDSRFLTPLGTIGSFEPGFRPSYMQAYNLTVERSLMADTIARISYVGNLGRYLSYNENLNYARYVPGNSSVANTQQRRLFPEYQGILMAMAGSTSSYHALQVSVERRVSKGLSFEANYTFSKAIDEYSIEAIPGSGQLPIPGNRRANRGLADFDIPSRFVASFVWALPSLSQHSPAVRRALGSWQVTGISTARSGTPFSVVSGSDLSFSGINGDYADLTGNPFLDSNRPRKDLLAEYFNRRAFAPNAPGTFGTAPRNLLRGLGSLGFDTGVMKDFRVAEKVNLQFRCEAFNVFNRPNFGRPENRQRVPRFGEIMSASDPRIVQLALKLRF